MEVLFTFLTLHKFLNHSSLVIGPFGFAYGLGAITLTFLLEKWKEKNKIEQVLDKTFNKNYLKNMFNDSWGK